MQRNIGFTDIFNQDPQSKNRAVMFTTFCLSNLLLPFTSLPLAAAELAENVVTFTESQASRGKIDYDENCASCHGFSLEGFGLIPSLDGSYFSGRWGDTPADELALNVRRMPPGEENSLG